MPYAGGARPSPAEGDELARARKRIEELEAENATLHSQMNDLEQRIEALEQGRGPSRQAGDGLPSSSWLGLSGLLVGLGLVWAAQREDRRDLWQGGRR